MYVHTRIQEERDKCACTLVCMRAWVQRVCEHACKVCEHVCMSTRVCVYIRVQLKTNRICVYLFVTSHAYMHAPAIVYVCICLTCCVYACNIVLSYVSDMDAHDVVMRLV